MKEADLYEDVTWQMSFWVFAFDLFDSSDFFGRRVSDLRRIVAIL